MANPTITFNTALNQQGALRGAADLRNKLSRQPIDIRLNTKSLAQPLGRITGDVAEFTKSLQAATARVTAFGATSGALYLLSRGFSELAKSVISVDKQLIELNTFLGQSSGELDKIGSKIFNIARNTASSFEEVAAAAKEFARQGLSAEETIKRTNDALILSRISGLGAAESVNALTTAINSFNKSSLSSTEIVNKLVKVDSNFAVSANDLAQALTRVGSAAQDSNIGFEQLIAAVTAAQQTTGRGGAVIGNAFKTIFTRLKRPEVLDELQALGVAVKDQNGFLLDGISILQNYTAATKNLSQVERARTDELLGGVFQINQLKALTSDLAKQNGIYARSLAQASQSADEAKRKNEDLNKSISSLLTRTATNFQQKGGSILDPLLKPLVTTGTSVADKLLDILSVDKTKTESLGDSIGQSLLKGIGQALSGPGLVVAGGIALSIGKNLFTFLANASNVLLNIPTQASKILAVEQAINNTLAQQPKLLQAVITGQVSREQAAAQLLALFRSQNQQLILQKNLASTLSRSFVSAGYSASPEYGITQTTRRKRSGGYLPQSSEILKEEKREAISKGAPSNVVPYFAKARIGGIEQMVAVNSAEKIIPNYAGGRDTAIIPSYIPFNKIPTKASGYVPNFADKDFSINSYGGLRSLLKSQNQKFFRVTYLTEDGIKRTIEQAVPLNPSSKVLQQGVKFEELKGALPPKGFSRWGDQRVARNIFSVRDPKTGERKTIRLDRILEIGAEGKTFRPSEDLSRKNLLTSRFNAAELKRISENQAREAIYSQKVPISAQQTESIIQKAESSTSNLSSFEITQLAMSGKISPEKILNLIATGRLRSPRLKLRSGGYIPNYAGLMDSVQREKTITGLPASEIMAHFDKSGRPIAVTNKPDEPLGLLDTPMMASKGYVPNYARGGSFRRVPTMPKSTSAMAAEMPRMPGESGLVNSAITSSVTQALFFAIPSIIGAMSTSGETTEATANTYGNLLKATSAVVGLTSVISGFKRGGIGGGVAAGVGALTTGALAFSQAGQMKDAVKNAAFEKVRNQSLDRFNKLTENVSSLSETIATLDSQYKDPSAKPTALLKLAKKQEELLSNVTKSNSELAVKIKTASTAEKKLELLAEAQDTNLRKQKIQEATVDFTQLSQGLRDAKEVRGYFETLSTQLDQSKINIGDLSKQNLPNALAAAGGESAIPLFKAQGDKFSQLFVDFLKGQKAKTTAESQASLRLMIAQGPLANLQMQTDRRNKFLAAESESRVGFLGDLSKFGSNFGDRASIEIQREVDTYLKGRERTRAFQKQFQTSVAGLPEGEAKSALSKLINQGPSQALGEKILRISSRTTDPDQKIILQNILAQNKLASSELQLIADLAKMQEEYAKRTLSLQERLTFEGGIKTSIDASAKVESAKSTQRGALQYQLGSLFGSKETQIAGLTNFATNLKEKYPGLLEGQGGKAMIGSIADQLTQLKTFDTIQSLRRDALVARSIGQGGLAQIMESKTNTPEGLLDIQKMSRLQAESQLGLTPSGLLKEAIGGSKAMDVRALQAKSESDLLIKQMEESLAPLAADINTKLSGEISKIFESFDKALTEMAGSKGLVINGDTTVIMKQVGKIVAGQTGGEEGKTKASGFIPNFSDESALADAVGREMDAGYSASQVLIGQNSMLRNSMNPLGLGVFNSTEGSLMNGISLARNAGINPMTKGMAKGFIPNFADNPEAVKAFQNALIQTLTDIAEVENINKFSKSQISNAISEVAQRGGNRFLSISPASLSQIVKNVQGIATLSGISISNPYEQLLTESESKTVIQPEKKSKPQKVVAPKVETPQEVKTPIKPEEKPKQKKKTRLSKAAQPSSIVEQSQTEFGLGIYDPGASNFEKLSIAKAKASAERLSKEQNIELIKQRSVLQPRTTKQGNALKDYLDFWTQNTPDNRRFQMKQEVMGQGILPLQILGRTQEGQWQKSVKTFVEESIARQEEALQTQKEIEDLRIKNEQERIKKGKALSGPAGQLSLFEQERQGGSIFGKGTGKYVPAKGLGFVSVGEMESGRLQKQLERQRQAEPYEGFMMRRGGFGAIVPPLSKEQLDDFKKRYEEFKAEQKISPREKFFRQTPEEKQKMERGLFQQQYGELEKEEKASLEKAALERAALEKEMQSRWESAFQRQKVLEENKKRKLYEKLQAQKLNAQKAKEAADLRASKKLERLQNVNLEFIKPDPNFKLTKPEQLSPTSKEGFNLIQSLLLENSSLAQSLISPNDYRNVLSSRSAFNKWNKSTGMILGVSGDGTSLVARLTRQQQLDANQSLGGTRQFTDKEYKKIINNADNNKEAAAKIKDIIIKKSRLNPEAIKAITGLTPDQLSKVSPYDLNNIMEKKSIRISAAPDGSASIDISGAKLSRDQRALIEATIAASGIKIETPIPQQRPDLAETILGGAAGQKATLGEKIKAGIYQSLSGLGGRKGGGGGKLPPGFLPFGASPEDFTNKESLKDRINRFLKPSLGDFGYVKGLPERGPEGNLQAGIPEQILSGIFGKTKPAIDIQAAARQLLELENSLMDPKTGLKDLSLGAKNMVKENFLSGYGQYADRIQREADFLSRQAGYADVKSSILDSISFPESDPKNRIARGLRGGESLLQIIRKNLSEAVVSGKITPQQAAKLQEQIYLERGNTLQNYIDNVNFLDKSSGIPRGPNGAKDFYDNVLLMGGFESTRAQEVTARLEAETLREASRRIKGLKIGQFEVPKYDSEGKPISEPYTGKILTEMQERAFEGPGGKSFAADRLQKLENLRNSLSLSGASQQEIDQAVKTMENDLMKQELTAKEQLAKKLGVEYDPVSGKAVPKGTLDAERKAKLEEFALKQAASEPGFKSKLKTGYGKGMGIAGGLVSAFGLYNLYDELSDPQKRAAMSKMEMGLTAAEALTSVFSTVGAVGAGVQGVKGNLPEGRFGKILGAASKGGRLGASFGLLGVLGGAKGGLKGLEEGKYLGAGLSFAEAGLSGGAGLAALAGQAGLESRLFGGAALAGLAARVYLTEGQLVNVSETDKQRGLLGKTAAGAFQAVTGQSFEDLTTLKGAFGTGASLAGLAFLAAMGPIGVAAALATVGAQGLSVLEQQTGFSNRLGSFQAGQGFGGELAGANIEDIAAIGIRKKSETESVEEYRKYLEEELKKSRAGKIEYTKRAEAQTFAKGFIPNFVEASKNYLQGELISQDPRINRYKNIKNGNELDKTPNVFESRFNASEEIPFFSDFFKPYSPKELEAQQNVDYVPSKNRAFRLKDSFAKQKLIEELNADENLTDLRKNFFGGKSIPLQFFSNQNMNLLSGAYDPNTGVIDLNTRALNFTSEGKKVGPQRDTFMHELGHKIANEKFNASDLIDVITSARKDREKYGESFNTMVGISTHGNAIQESFAEMFARASVGNYKYTYKEKENDISDSDLYKEMVKKRLVNKAFGFIPNFAYKQESLFPENPEGFSTDLGPSFRKTDEEYQKERDELNAESRKKIVETYANSQNLETSRDKVQGLMNSGIEFNKSDFAGNESLYDSYVNYTKERQNTLMSERNALSNPKIVEFRQEAARQAAELNSFSPEEIKNAYGAGTSVEALRNRNQDQEGTFIGPVGRPIGGVVYSEDEVREAYNKGTSVESLRAKKDEKNFVGPVGRVIDGVVYSEEEIREAFNKGISPKELRRIKEKNNKLRKNNSMGFIPNFSAFARERSQILNSPDYAGYRDAMPMPSSYYRGVTINSREIEVPATDVYSRMGLPPGTRPSNPSEKTAILNPAQQNALGYAGGFVPNFSNEQFMTMMSEALKNGIASAFANGFIPNFAGTSNMTNTVNINGSSYVSKDNDKINMFGKVVDVLRTLYPRELAMIGPEINNIK